MGGSVVWNLDVDKSSLSAGLADARSEVKQTAQEVDKSFSGISNHNCQMKKRSQLVLHLLKD